MNIHLYAHSYKESLSIEGKNVNGLAYVCTDEHSVRSDELKIHWFRPSDCWCMSVEWERVSGAVLKRCSWRRQFADDPTRCNWTATQTIANSCSSRASTSYTLSSALPSQLTSDDDDLLRSNWTSAQCMLPELKHSATTVSRLTNTSVRRHLHTRRIASKLQH